MAVIALWVGGISLALPYLADRYADRSTSVDTVEVAIEPDADEDETAGEGGSQGPGGSEDGDEQDSEGDEGGEDEGPGGTGVRASGQITGPSPGGVTISVLPASSLWVARDDDATSTQAQGASRIGDHLAGRGFGEVVAGTLAAMHPVAAAARGLLRTAVAVTAPRAATGGKILATALPLAPSDGASQRMSVRSDDKGAWAIAGLSPTARYLVSVSKPGFQTQRVLRTGDELAATPLETELRAGTGQLSGTVTGPDGVAGGVEITISDGTTTVTTRTATRGDVGRWQVDGLTTPATYLVTAASDRLGARSRLVQLGASGVRTVDLRLRPGLASVSGRVIGTDSLGEVGGVGGLTVTATGGSESRSATTATGVDESVGTFTLSDLPVPGTYTVTVSGTGYNTVTRELRLGTSGRTGWDIPVGTQGGTVTGTVRSDGAGVAGVGLTLTSDSNSFRTMSGSDGDGTYLFSGIPAGTYVLTSQAFGYEGTFTEVVVRDGRTARPHLTLTAMPDDGLTATGSITGRVTDASKGSHVECTALFGDEECLVHARVDFKRLDGTPAFIETRVAPTESYVLPGTDPSRGDALPPGRYTVQLSAPGYEPGSVQVTVGMGVAAEAATVALVPSPSLIGTVIPRVGVLPAGTCVVVSPPGEDPVAGVADPCVDAVEQCNSATSRCVQVEAGSYTIDRLRAGPYVVRLANLDPAYRVPPEVEINLRPGDLRRHDFTVERLGIINLTVLEAGNSGAITTAGTVTIRASRIGSSTPRTTTTLNGFVSLASLEPGTWELDVVESAGAPALASTIVQVDLNQEVAAQIVITNVVSTFDFYVGWQRLDGDMTPIENATVRVTGVTQYVGTIPTRTGVDFHTNVNGFATVCTSEEDCPDEPFIKLIDASVDIMISAPGFQTVTWNSVLVPHDNSVALAPNGVDFDGQIVLDPVPAPSATNPYSGVNFEVVQAPPGTGRVSLSVAPETGEVSISDSAGSGGNRIRPGDWVIRANRTGFNSAELEFYVPPGASSQSVSWLLEQHGRLVVHVEHAGDHSAIPGARVLLRKNGAELGTLFTNASGHVDFGDLPPSDADPDSLVEYELEVHAAGFGPADDVVVDLAAGRTAAQLFVVPLVQLGAISGVTRTHVTGSVYETLTGATVRAAWEGAGDAEEFTASSGTGGSYRVTGEIDEPELQAGPWSITATADGHQPGAYTGGGSTPVNVVLDAGMQQSGIDIALRPNPSELTVTVLDGETRVTNATVVLRPTIGSGAVYACDPVTDGDACAGLGPGEHRFLNLLPITYTISVTAEGGFLAVTVQHKIELDSRQSLPIALSAPNGSVQGTLYQRNTNGGLDALAAHFVQLSSADPEFATRTVPTASNGRFSLPEVPAGEYTLTAYAEVEDGVPVSDALVSREIEITSGQSTVLDLTVELSLVPIEVRVTSQHGTDLSGAQVVLDGVLDGGGPAQYGPATLVRSSPSGSVYVASFPQLPLGTWQPTVSGPAGHFGQHVGPSVEVTSGHTAPIEMQVAEREVRLRAVAPTGIAPPGGVQSTIDVGSGPTAFSVERSVQIGASDIVLYVPTQSVEIELSSVPTGWSASVAPSSSQGPGSGSVTFEVRIVPSVSATFCSTPSTTVLTAFSCFVQLSGAPQVIGNRSVEVSVGAWTQSSLTNGSGRANFTVPADVVGLADFTVTAVAVVNGATLVEATRAVSVTSTGSFSTSICSGEDATASTAFSCTVTFSAPSAYDAEGDSVTVRVRRGFGPPVWSTTLQVAADESVEVEVPATHVGTQNFSLEISWAVPGLPSSPVVSSRTVIVTEPDTGGGDDDQDDP